VGFYPTTLLENAILASIAVFIFETARDRRQISWRSPFVLPGLLFVLAGAMAAVTAPSPRLGLGLYRAYIVEPMLFAAVLVNVIRTPRRALTVIAALAAGAAVAGLANSIVVLIGLLNRTYDVRETPPVVIYSTANAVALYVVPITAVAGSLALFANGRERLVGLGSFVVGVVVTALSFSRGGYLAMAAVVAGSALSHRRRLILLGLAAAGAGAVALVPPILHRILIETQNVYGNTVFSRLELWSAALKLLERRPILGAGLSGFQERVAPFYARTQTSANFIDPHNIVLNFWVETGLLGLIAIVWIFVTAFRVSWLGWRRGDPDWRPYQLGVFLAMVAVVVHGMVDVPYFKNDLSLEFWTLIAITTAGIRWGASSLNQARPQSAQLAA
jgi:O-antigen ligase